MNKIKLIMFSSYIHPFETRANGLFLFHGHVILIVSANLQYLTKGSSWCIKIGLIQ